MAIQIKTSICPESGQKPCRQLCDLNTPSMRRAWKLMVWVNRNQCRIIQRVKVKPGTEGLSSLNFRSEFNHNRGFVILAQLLFNSLYVIKFLRTYSVHCFFGPRFFARKRKRPSDPDTTCQ